jgi:hypothetical protein
MVQNRRKRPAKRSKRRRLSQSDQFVQIYNSLIKSEAWRNCSPAAIKVFMLLCSRYHGTNNGEIAASMRDIGRTCGFSKDRACRSINELLDWKLIEVVTPGTYGGRKASEYGIMIWDCHVTRRPAIIRWEPAAVLPPIQSSQRGNTVVPFRARIDQKPNHRKRGI